MSETAAVAAPGRPRSAEKRDAILVAARDLLLEHGFPSTSMEMVAEKAGVGKPTIYRHFGNKQELTTAVIEQRRQQLVAALGPMNDTAPDPGTDLRAFGCRFVELILNPKARAWDRLVIAEADRHPELARTLFQAGPRYVHGIVRDYIAAAVDAGKLHTSDPDEAAEHLISLLLGLELLRGQMASQPRRSKAQREQRAIRAVEAFLSAYAAEASAG